MSNCIVCYVTVPSLQVSQKIASALVRGRLIACCNIIPSVTSIYEWEGKVCMDQEYLLMIKTTQDKLQEMTSAILALHPYQVPEVIATAPLIGGSSQYLNWVVAQTKKEPLAHEAGENKNAPHEGEREQKADVKTEGKYVQ